MLSNSQIREQHALGNIVIEPYDDGSLGVNAYDVRLGQHFYRERLAMGGVVNPFQNEQAHARWVHCEATAENAVQYGLEEGQRYILLHPGESILGHTMEFIGTRMTSSNNQNFVAMLQTRSGIERNNVDICQSSALVNTGFCYRITLEIRNLSKLNAVILPVGEKIGQVVFFHTGPMERFQHSTYHPPTLSSNGWTPQDMLPRLSSSLGKAILHSRL